MRTALEDALVRRLHDAADSIESARPPLVAPARPSRRRRWLVASGAGLGLALAGGAAVAQLSTPPELEVQRGLIEVMTADMPGGVCGDITPGADWRAVAREVFPAGDSIELWVLESSRGYYTTIRSIDADGTFVSGGGGCASPASPEGTITSSGSGDIGTTKYHLEVFGQVDPTARSVRFTVEGVEFTAPVGEEGWYLRRVGSSDVGGQLITQEPTEVEAVP